MEKLLSLFGIALIFLLSGCHNKPNPDEVKVLTLNLRYDNPGDSANAWPHRTSIVCDFIKEQKPDIFGMQEVLSHQYDQLDSALTEYCSIGEGRNDGARSGEMNPVFFKKDRFDLIRTITFWLSETPDVPGSMAWGASLPRIVTWVELAEKESHEHFFYFNTHFAHDSDSARILSSKLLLAKVDSIASGFPFIVTGDFNMSTDSKGYSILTGPHESIPLFADSYTISQKEPVGPVNTYNGWTDNMESGRIDFIFVRKGMKVLNHITTIKKDHGVFISDHWPVMSTVLLKNN
ncbi:MAG TPA: endonuclease/exonuclease/phosphatase family protein [Bacteroidales bacterium]|nr:endonuclease/exonuclease/phosphatase family protein [Bacteroidales bacterium]